MCPIMAAALDGEAVESRGNREPKRVRVRETRLVRAAVELTDADRAIQFREAV
jgi:hypothetical protein